MRFSVLISPVAAMQQGQCWAWSGTDAMLAYP